MQSSAATQTPIPAKRSELAEAFIKIDGKPFSLQNYPMFKEIYDGGHDSILLMTCRQVGKSTTIATFNIAESIGIEHFRTYFISPTREQTQKFSTLRVGKMIQYSDELRTAYVDERLENRVNLRMFRNGSELAFNYAMDDADRCRGYSCDRICLDEIQDMILSSVEPVVRECMSASEYKYSLKGGTPKSMENDIQVYWEASTQTEWATKCTGCGKYTLMRSEKVIGKLGPICLHCGKYINPRNGCWVDMKPGAALKGFHIARPMMPVGVPVSWNEGTKGHERALKEWADILDKFEGPKPYSLSMFRNEVMGVSDSQGRRLVTRELLESMCTGPQIEMRPTPQQLQGIVAIGVGIDWSGGGTEMLSRTVMTVVGLTTKKTIRLLYFKIFPGTNPVEEMAEIASIIGMNPNIRMIVCDAGEGNMNTEMLRRRVGRDKVSKARYGSPKWHCKWDAEGGFLSVNRTWSIDSLMSALQRKEFEFPTNIQQMTPAFDDVLAEYEEVTKLGYKVWRHAPTQPDDFLHALNFARIAVQMVTGDLDLTS